MIQSIIGEDNFRKVVLESKLPVLVDFWGEHCPPCIPLGSILEELAREYNGKVNFAKVNVEDNSSLASKYGIAAIPTTLIFNDGQPVQQVVGLKPKRKLKKILDGFLRE